MEMRRRLVFSLGESRKSCVQSGIISCSLAKVRFDTHAILPMQNLLFEPVAYQITFEAQLPHDEKDMIE